MSRPTDTKLIELLREAGRRFGHIASDPTRAKSHLGANNSMVKLGNELMETADALDGAASRVPSESPAQKVTRFEVIDHRESMGADQGRTLVLHDIAVELAYQDAGRTLKVFLHDPSLSSESPPAQQEP